MNDRPRGGSRALAPYLALTLSAAFWGGTWVVGRGVHDDVPPVALAFWRWVVACAILLPFCWRRLAAQRAQLRRERGKLIVMSVVGISAFTAMIFIGLRSTTAINGALINAATPVYVILLSYAGVGERGSWRQVAGVAVAFVGLAIIITRGDPVRLLALDVGVGDLWILGAMFLWALYNIMLRSWRTELDQLAFVGATAAIGTLALAPAYLAELAVGAQLHLTMRAAGGIAYLGTFASVGAYLCWNYGVPKVGAAPASIIQYLIPVFAAIFAVLILAERLHPFHLVGVALIVGGIWLANAVRRAAG